MSCSQSLHTCDSYYSSNMSGKATKPRRGRGRGKEEDKGVGRGRGRGASASVETPKKTTTKKGKVGGRGAAKGSSRVVLEEVVEEVVPQKEASEGDEVEEERVDAGPVDEATDPPAGEGEDVELEEEGENWGPERLRQETLIAAFYQARPYFNNKRDEAYKKTQSKNAEMAELVKELGKPWTCNDIFSLINEKIHKII